MASELTLFPDEQERLPAPAPFSMYQRPNLMGLHEVMVIGEAPGESEERVGIPFIGAAGDLLNELLQIVGFRRATIHEKGKPDAYASELHVTNVFSKRPPGNDLQAWTINKTDLRRAGWTEVGRLPQIRKRYLHPNFEPEVLRLHAEIAQVGPDLIIALGGTALWALTGDAKITQSRGNFFTPVNIVTGEPYVNLTAIASFHPAAILRKYDDRPVLWADLHKAKSWLDKTLPEPLARTFWIDPTFEEIQQVYARFAAHPEWIIGVDIETDPRCDQITSISFGTEREAICIPIWDKYALPDRTNYWPTAEDEARAWQWIRSFGALPNRKVGQNWLYDMQYLLEPLDIRIAAGDDTAILQHSMQPELPKALGFLASVYLNEPSWKFMRTSTKDDNKADE